MKRLLLIRHGSRDTLVRSDDNGLNEKGQRQAQALAVTLEKYLNSAESVSFCSSPKARCQETVAPLAQALGQKVIVDLRLDERALGDDERQLIARLKSFLADWKSRKGDALVACSHGDVLPALVELATGRPLEFHKAMWALLTLEGQAVSLSQVQRTVLDE